MPSKRAFAKRLAALAATGLGIGEPIDSLTGQPPPDAVLAADSAPAGGAGGAADSGPTSETASDRAGAGGDGPRSAVAAGTYDPASTASASADTVVTGRLDPTALAATGLPGGVGGRVRRLLGRYDAVSLAGVRQATGGAALTDDGVEGCAVAVGDVDAAAMIAELDSDPEVVREPDDGSGFVRFRARTLGSAVAVADGELVAAHGPDPTVAGTHRDAGTGGGAARTGRRRAAATANYGPLPGLLGGDATVCVDLGPDARAHLRDALADAPAELQTALDASGAVGASLRVIDDSDDRDDGPRVALRYGAVADPRRLDLDTAEALARAAREGETSLSEATVTRHGRTVIVDGAADGDLFASHASLLGAGVGDPIEVTDG
ncbi:hypothetical protein [Halorubrum saccharovorum]|nr:hypothetical protein [Halorubrum saccharovorum]